MQATAPLICYRPRYSTSTSLIGAPESNMNWLDCRELGMLRTGNAPGA